MGDNKSLQAEEKINVGSFEQHSFCPARDLVKVLLHLNKRRTEYTSQSIPFRPGLT